MEPGGFRYGFFDASDDSAEYSFQLLNRFYIHADLSGLAEVVECCSIDCDVHPRGIPLSYFAGSLNKKSVQ